MCWFYEGRPSEREALEAVCRVSKESEESQATKTVTALPNICAFSSLVGVQRAPAPHLPLSQTTYLLHGLPVHCLVEADHGVVPGVHHEHGRLDASDHETRGGAVMSCIRGGGIPVTGRRGGG